MYITPGNDCICRKVLNCKNRNTRCIYLDRTKNISGADTNIYSLITRHGGMSKVTILYNVCPAEIKARILLKLYIG